MNGFTQRSVFGITLVGAVLALAGCKVTFGEATEGEAGAAGANSGGTGGGSGGTTGGTGAAAGSAGAPGGAGGLGGASGGSGGVCNPGACASSDIAVGLFHPERVVVDATSVFFTDDKNDGRLVSVKKDGSDVTTLLEQNIYLWALAEEGDHVYVTHYPGVLSVPKAGGSAVNVAPVYGVEGVLPAAEGLWLIGSGGLDHYHFGMKKLDQDRSEGVSFITTDATQLYAYQRKGPNGAPTVLRLPIAGGTPAPVAAGPASSDSYIIRHAFLAVDGDSLLVFYQTDPTLLFSVPKAGGTPLQLAQAGVASEFVGVAAHGGYGYFLEWDSDYSITSLRRVPTQGGTVDTLFQTDGECSHLAVDDSFVYITNRDQGKVHKVQR
ncbi:MAG: hypothetical protein R3B13_13070 [Polyangiaceae bacterium]